MSWPVNANMWAQVDKRSACLKSPFFIQRFGLDHPQLSSSSSSIETQLMCPEGSPSAVRDIGPHSSNWDHLNQRCYFVDWKSPSKCLVAARHLGWGMIFLGTDGSNPSWYWLNHELFIHKWIFKIQEDRALHNVAGVMPALPEALMEALGGDTRETSLQMWKRGLTEAGPAPQNQKQVVQL